MSNPAPSPGFQINEVECAIYLGEDGTQGGIYETWTDRGLEISIDFIVAWEDRIKFLQGLRGSASWDGTSPGTVTRNHPFFLPSNPNDLFPDLPDLAQTLYAWERYVCFGTSAFKPVAPRVDKDGSITGFVGWVYYDYVLIQAHFSSPTYFILDNKVPYTQGYDLSGYPYTTTTTKTTGEIFAPEANSYKFEKVENVPVNTANAAIYRPRTEITITRHYMPMVDTLSYEKLIGTVNKNPLIIGSQTYPAESVLYMSYEVEPYGDVSTGTTYCDIKHQLMGNSPVQDTDGKPQSSWNYFLTPNGNWDRLVLTSDNKTPVYQQADFLPSIWPDYQ